MATQIDISNLIDNLKNSLGIGKLDIIGLDIGQSSVKLSEVRSNGSEVVLQRYKSVPLPEGAIIEDEIHDEEIIVEALKTAYDEGGFTSKNFCLGLSGVNTIARKLQVAGGSEEDIEDQVLWEAEQYLPFPFDECKMDHFVLGENEGGGVDVMIAAVRKDIMDSYKKMVESAGFKVKIVDLCQIALVNSFNFFHPESVEEGIEDAGSWVLVDIGAQKTIFMILKKGIPVFIKEIGAGGSMVTEEIQRQLGVTFQEAEDLKRSGDGNGNLPEEVLEIMDDIVEVLFGEIKKTIDFYISSTSDSNFKGCAITGGSSSIPGLLEGLRSLLNTEVEVLNPFNVLEYGNMINESDLNEIVFRGIASLGLALRQLEND